MAKRKTKASKAGTATEEGAPKMDTQHAKLIAEAEAACKRTEKNWKVLKEGTKAAKQTFDQALDNLRKLAEDITEKDLFAQKDRP